MGNDLGTRPVFYYLYNEERGVTQAQMVGLKEAYFQLPGFQQKWVTGVGVREKRILVVFDGFLPEGGLPKNVMVVDTAPCRINGKIPTNRFVILVPDCTSLTLRRHCIIARKKVPLELHVYSEDGKYTVKWG